MIQEIRVPLIYGITSHILCIRNRTQYTGNQSEAFQGQSVS